MKGTKTQTRRDSSKYQTGHTYAIQSGRGKPADPRGRILITHMWIENAYIEKGEEFSIHPLNAEAEGGYTPKIYEMLYESLHPLWETRYAYEFEFWSTESLESLKTATREAKNHPSIPYFPLPSRMSKGERMVK